MRQYLKSLNSVYRLLILVGMMAVMCIPRGAWAHMLVAQCYVDSQDIVCRGEYSTGTGAVDLPVEVLDYDDAILTSGKLDANSEFRFNIPEGDFYVFINGGVGHTVEIDNIDIDGL